LPILTPDPRPLTFTFSYLTKCPFTRCSCNNHPETAQNCQRNAKNYQKMHSFYKKVRAFYKKIAKNCKKYQFFCRIHAPNLPICDKSQNPIKRPLQPWVQRGDRLKRHKQMCLVHYVYFVFPIYTGAPDRQFVTLFLRFLEKKYKTTIIQLKTAKKITPEVFNLLFRTDYLSFQPV